MTAIVADVAGSPSADPILANAPHRIGKVSLLVRDLDRVGRFYQEVLGLQVMHAAPSLLQLGHGSTALLELRHAPNARLRSPREAGLFHTAFLLPSRADLAAWVSHAAERQVTIQGASDHLVSGAIYLADPEGNGIEIYVDRPSSTWEVADGAIKMATEPLDLHALVRDAAGRRWSGFPEGGTVGHVHLQVGDLEPAEAFYGGLLGFEITCRYPGATFFGSGGYHHQLATNVWNSRGAGARSDGMTGLEEVEISVDAAGLEAVRARLPNPVSSTQDPAVVRLRDPWGTSITLLGR